MPTSTVHFRDLLHAANLRHGTHGFTSLPKESVLRIFPPLKIRRLRPGLNSRTWVPEASTLNPRPPKPLMGRGSTPRPGHFILAKQTLHLLYRRLIGPQGRYRRVRKISPLPGFDLRTVQPVYVLNPISDSILASSEYKPNTLNEGHVTACVGHHTKIYGYYSKSRIDETRTKFCCSLQIMAHKKQPHLSPFIFLLHRPHTLCSAHTKDVETRKGSTWKAVLNFPPLPPPLKKLTR
jgi:hypothetical protein